MKSMKRMQFYSSTKDMVAPGRTTRPGNSWQQQSSRRLWADQSFRLSAHLLWTSTRCKKKPRPPEQDRWGNKQRIKSQSKWKPRHGTCKALGSSTWRKVTTLPLFYASVSFNELDLKSISFRFNCEWQRWRFTRRPDTYNCAVISNAFLGGKNIQRSNSDQPSRNLWVSPPKIDPVVGGHAQKDNEHLGTHRDRTLNKTKHDETASGFPAADTRLPLGFVRRPPTPWQNCQVNSLLESWSVQSNKKCLKQETDRRHLGGSWPENVIGGQGKQVQEHWPIVWGGRGLQPKKRQPTVLACRTV